MRKKTKNTEKLKKITNDIFTCICKSDLKVTCVKEYKFHPVRRWRFDYAIPDHKIAVEVEGGVFKESGYRGKDGLWHTRTGGRHNTGEGFLNDMEKYNTATIMGWRILRCIPDDLLSMKTINMLKEAILNEK